VERIEPEQTFEVPRTALLLTGSVKSLLPLPAQFSAAVQNTDRKSSAADLLWPSNISSNWDGSSDASSTGRPSRVSAPGHSGSDSMQRQASAPSSTLLQNSAVGSEPQLGPAGSSDGNSSAAAGLEMSNLKVVVHDVTEQREQSASDARAPAAGSSSAAARHSGDPLWLQAPGELPPGEFKCIEQGMLLQVGALGDMSVHYTCIRRVFHSPQHQHISLLNPAAPSLTSAAVHPSSLCCCIH
jgi:hypothetical protein